MTTLGFTGDIAFSRHTKDAWQKPDLLDPAIVSYLRDTDCTVPNVEGALYRSTGSGTFHHASDPRAVDWLRKINGTLWNLANNHILDCGEEGLTSTMELAEANGCRTMGADRDLDAVAQPRFVGNVGLISLCYKRDYCTDGEAPGCVFQDNDPRIRAAIETVRKTCRWCVIVVHSGEEFTSMPLPTHRDRYLRYLEMGADVVVGHHPHVVQNYEIVAPGKMIFYSLGNFIFDTDYQRKQKYTDRGVLLRLRFGDDAFDWDSMAVRIDRATGRVVPGETPAIFTDIQSGLYEKLWPLAASVMHKNYRVKKAYGNPEREAFTDEQWQEYERELAKDPLLPCADMLLGERLLPDCGWESAPETLKSYLLSGVSDEAK